MEDLAEGGEGVGVVEEDEAFEVAGFQVVVHFIEGGYSNAF